MHAHLDFCRESTLSCSCCSRLGCLRLDRMDSTVTPSALILQSRINSFHLRSSLKCFLQRPP